MRARSANGAAPMLLTLHAPLELLTCIRAPVLTAQPFAEQELGPRQMRREAAAGQTFDGLLVQRARGGAVGQERTRTRLHP